MDYAPIVASLIAFFGVLVTLGIGYRNLERSLAAAGWQKANEAEIEEIDAKLNNFFTPFTMILGRDHYFAGQLREKYGDMNSETQDKEYRLLPKLFEAAWLEGLTAGEAALVEQVCMAAKELDDLIGRNFATLDDGIVPYFVFASSHFRILHLAYRGKLGDDGEVFADYKYPMALDDVVRYQINRLKERKSDLIANMTNFNKPMGPLELPDEPKFKLKKLPDPGSRVARLLGLEENDRPEEESDL